MSQPHSCKLFERACEVIPGGVNSPVRAFRAVGGQPLFIREGKGPYVFDADGKRYVDFVGSWGPLILGHADPLSIKAVCEAAQRGFSYGAPTEGEILLAEEVRAAYPAMELVRLTSSGTEAVMGALRLARGFTGRELVVKFEGCYHGGADYLLVKAGSGAATLGYPDSAGVPASIAQTTMVLPFNDLEAVQQAFAERGSDIAAVIVEPIVGNMGCVLPVPGFLQGLRELCSAHSALLVFDEVMTGFRVAYGGAQAIYNVVPDLVCLGKILGGGLPIGAYGGHKDIMQKVAPLGPVYQAGTLSGNPLSVAAGLATLKALQKPDVYTKLELTSAHIETSLLAAASAQNIHCTVQRVGSMLTAFFNAQRVLNWSDASKSNTGQFATWHQALLSQGVYWPPSQYEAAFVSLAHDEEALQITNTAFQVAFRSLV